MEPEFIFNAGIMICGIAVIFAVIAIILLRHLKIRLNQKFDFEFGKRRH